MTMMEPSTVDIQDVLSANVVILGSGLFQNNEGIREFTGAVGGEVTIEIPNALPGLPTSLFGTQLSLRKERILLDISSERTTFRMEYPALEGLQRLASIVARANEHLKIETQTVIAVGFNVDLVYAQHGSQPATRYLAERLLKSGLSENQQPAFTCTSIKLNRQFESSKLTVTIEPRFGDETTSSVFNGYNLHVPMLDVPNEDTISNMLTWVWNYAHSFPMTLDGVR